MVFQASCRWNIIIAFGKDLVGTGGRSGIGFRQYYCMVCPSYRAFQWNEMLPPVSLGSVCFGQGLLSLKTIYLLSVPGGVAVPANQLQVKLAFTYAHYTI